MPTSKFSIQRTWKGTMRLLDYSKNTNSVKAFVYTSSSSVVEGPYVSVDETRSLITRSSSGANHYSISKARAEELVVKANNRAELRTVSLRIAGIYGDRDNQMIPGTLKVLRDKRQHVQIGDNSTLFDFYSATNAATAHILAARALLAGMEDPAVPKVDGEVFFITDGKSMPFWTFSRKVWGSAGDRTPPEKIKKIPAWFVLSIAITMEWIY